MKAKFDALGATGKAVNQFNQKDLITRLKLFGYSGYKVLTKKEDIIDLYCQWEDCPTMQFDDLAVNTFFFSLLKNDANSNDDTIDSSACSNVVEI